MGRWQQSHGSMLICCCCWCWCWCCDVWYVICGTHQHVQGPSYIQGIAKTQPHQSRVFKWWYSLVIWKRLLGKWCHLRRRKTFLIHKTSNETFISGLIYISGRNCYLHKKWKWLTGPRSLSVSNMFPAKVKTLLASCIRNQITHPPHITKYTN